LYLIRDASISRLTHDHSYVTRLVENGIIRAEEAESHPQRHILTAALGAGSSITPDAPEQPFALQSGDVLVLCTDGLWGLLSDREIQEIVSGKTVDEICHALVATAKKRGGPDNITVQVLKLS
jgi:protein phosphatase